MHYLVSDGLEKVIAIIPTMFTGTHSFGAIYSRIYVCIDKVYVVLSFSVIRLS